MVRADVSGAVDGLDFLGMYDDFRNCMLMKRLLSRVSLNLSICIRKVSKGRAEEKAFSRLLRQPKCPSSAVLKACFKKTQTNGLESNHVLVIQDSSDFTFANSNLVAGFRKHFGLMGNNTARGFKLQAALAYDASSLTCLGLSSLERIYRPAEAQARPHRSVPIEDKESMRWLRVGLQSKKLFAQVPMVTIIADRESDIYDEWCRIPDSRTHLLTRCSYDRALVGGDRLFRVLEQSKLQGRALVTLQAITGKRLSRIAEVEIRFTELTIKKSDTCTDKSLPKQLALTAVEVREIPSTPMTEKPVLWRLLTTHSVENMAKAIQIIDWYKLRWNIEQYFRTLKTQGFKIEESLIEDQDVIGKLTDIACISAATVMQLVAARSGAANNVPCSILFEKEEIKLLKQLNITLQGKTKIQQNPHKNNSVSWASWIIARLGGWKSYSKSERPPGPITMKRGLDIFHQYNVGWTLRGDLGIR